MAHSKTLADRIREALADLPDVEEKKMFGKIAFMVNGKMCLTAGTDRMMCRIDPEIHDKVVKGEGCRTVVMRGRKYKGYVHVDEEFLRTKKEFNYWIKLALSYNEKAQKTGKKKKSSISNKK